MVVETVVLLFGIGAVVWLVALVLEVVVLKNVVDVVVVVVAAVVVVAVVVVVVAAAAAAAAAAPGAVPVFVGLVHVLTSMHADEHVDLHGEPQTGVELQRS